MRRAAGAGVSAVSITARLPWERAEGKVQPWHRDRLAAVYVRQSTAAQVQDHTGSTRLQYGLAERAVTLGWAPSRVLVIDEDLGHSASGADARPGFARLVAEVGLDHVGIVLGIEMSRLARSGREWHQLLELCALSGALLGDLDGVYDPAEHNDRLLLGPGSPAVPPARWCWIRMSRCAVWPAWSSACSSGWARWVPCWGFSRTTASSWECGCGRDPRAGSWPGAAPAAPG